MSEEIIVNGTNVTSCEFLSESIICKSLENPNQICPDYDNCYFKQLKRLQQENEELKEMLLKEPKAMQAFQTAYSGLKKDNEVLWGMIKDYKTALEEIREIAKFNQFYNPEKLIINGDIGQIQDLKMTEIYNKIDEVLNDRD